MQVFKILKEKTLFTINILFYRTLHLFHSWDMTQKEREEGASHTLLTVRLIIYQHHSLLSNIPL